MYAKGLGPFANMKGAGFLNNLPNIFSLGSDKAMNALKVGGAGAVITGLLAEREQGDNESNEDYAKRRAQVNDQLKVQFPSHDHQE